jgi:hypothetical protein
MTELAAQPTLRVWICDSKEREMAFSPNGVFPALHALALRGTLKQLPGDAREFEAEGLVRSTTDGFTLTEAGHRHHRTLLEQERAALDIGLLGIIFEGFPAVGWRLDKFASLWRAADARARRRLVAELVGMVDEVEPILRRSAKVVPRFAGYIERLDEARERLTEGNLNYGVDPGVESIQTVLRELEEDYLQTIGRGYEQEDSRDGYRGLRAGGQP